MLLARNARGQVLVADHFTRKESEKVYCPGCHGEVIFKKGSQKIPHFAHRANQECRHFSEGETAEHLAGKRLLQRVLPLGTQLEAYLPRLNQRPDLLWRTLAVEFQCSSLSRERFTERTMNYLAQGYTPWWLVGQRFFPTVRLQQLTKCCLQDAPLGPVLWGVAVEEEQLLLFHSFDWHYQKGMSCQKASRQMAGPLFRDWVLPTSRLPTDASWSISQYQRYLREKLWRKDKGIMNLQSLGYVHGVNLLDLPNWCYRPGRYQGLLQEGLLLLRGLYVKQTLDIVHWLEMSMELLDWPYLLVDQRQVLQEVYEECQCLARNLSEETRKF